MSLVKCNFNYNLNHFYHHIKKIKNYIALLKQVQDEAVCFLIYESTSDVSCVQLIFGKRNIKAYANNP